MKKVLLLVVALTMATVSVKAQEEDYDLRHEVSISYGALSCSQILDAFRAVYDMWAGAQLDGRTSIVGPISAEYYYHIEDWFAVGGIVAFGRTSQDIFYYDEVGGGKIGKDYNTYYTVMPSVKFNWFRREHFGLYSKVAAGVTIRNMKAVSLDPRWQTYNETLTHFNFQATAIGAEFGGVNFRGFVELGMGEQGVALAGLRWRF